MSSWNDIKNGHYGSTYNIDYDPITICGDWKLSFGAYLDEDPNLFWFEDDEEGGTGSTDIGAVAWLENPITGAEIRMPFGINYSIFGNPENPDEFYLSEPDRSLDHEAGIWWDIDEISGIDINEAREFVDDNLQEIFDAIIDVVNKNLYKFGYEL